MDEAVCKMIEGHWEDKEMLLRVMGSDVLLEQYHHTLGQWIRNNFGLWNGNAALLESCGREHPDDASYVILGALRERVKGQQ